MKSTKAVMGLFTSGDVARRCGVAPRTASKWIDNGLLVGHRLPGSQDRRVRREDLVKFCRDNGYPFEDLLGEFSVNVCLTGSTRTVYGGMKRMLAEAAGYMIHQCQNAFHAARIAHTSGCDIMIVDASIGVLIAEEMVTQLPVSRHTGERPLLLWLESGGGQKKPKVFDAAVREDEVPGIVELVKREASRLLTAGLGR